MEKHLPILRQCPLFRGIDFDQLPVLLACLGAKTIAREKNEPVFFAGDPATSVGIVLDGAALVVRDDYDGSRSIVARFESAGMFGEAFACANVEKLPVSVIAAQKSAFLLIDCRRITTACGKACSHHSRLIQNLLGIVAARNLLLNQKIEILTQRTTREKLMAYLLAEARRNHARAFTIPYDRQALADYLGVERSALSVEIGKLRREGVLKSERSFFQLLK